MQKSAGFRAARRKEPRVRRAIAYALLIGGCAGAAACEKSKAAQGEISISADSKPDPMGSSVMGMALAEHYECGRCHEGTGASEISREKRCFTCHLEVANGDVKASAADVTARWKERVTPLTHAPSLWGSGKRFRRGFIERYLLNPIDLRPHLMPQMPRLSITAEQARDIASYLAPEDDTKSVLSGADPARGKKLMDEQGCGTCHAFSGAPPLKDRPPKFKPGEFVQWPVRLAPDLRFTRERLRLDWLLGWLQNPKAHKPDTLMPDTKLLENEAKDIAAYLVSVPLAPLEMPKVPNEGAAPPGRISFDEVNDRVFHRTCWHCHSDASYGIGDGGPGNTGGFGFKGRGLDLSAYDAILSGILNEKGERVSVFHTGDDGTPLLVKALWARWEEEAGRPVEGVRGMPLGMPPLPVEDIQLVEAWIAQGKPE